MLLALYKMFLKREALHISYITFISSICGIIFIQRYVEKPYRYFWYI